MTSTPDWLAELLAEAAPRPPRQTPTGLVAKQPGQIWRALAMDRTHASALVLVVDVDEHTHHASVVLLTPDVELAGSRDYLLLGNDTGTGYDLAAQTELASNVWEVQLDAYLGDVPADQLDTIHEMVRDGEASPQRNHLAGPPIVEPTDPRWNFKRTELRRLQKLSNECVRQFIDGEAAHLLPDPSALRITANPAENLELEEYVLAVLDAIGHGRMDLPVWLIERIFDNPESVAILRASGLFDVVRALLGKAVGRLGDEDPQLIYSTESTIGHTDYYEGMRQTLLSQARGKGATSVAFVVRSADYSPHDQLTRIYVHEHLMQCATIQDRTLVGRNY